MTDLLTEAKFIETQAGTGAFRALIENLGECVYLLDSQGRCVVVNSSFGQWLGRPETALLGGTVFDLWPRPLADKEAVEHLRVLRGELIEAEEERPRGQQSSLVRILKVPVRDDNGAVWGVLCLFREVGQASRLSRPATGETPVPPAERQASKLELLGRLTSGIVHDFNNLLSVQRTNLSFLQSNLPPGTALEEPLRALQKAIDQGSALTDRLLMLVRQGREDFRPLDVNEICTEAIALLKSSIAPRIALEARLWPDLPPVHGDFGQLVQVLLNLCFNACDAMPRGGQLLIETEERHGSYVCLRVRDTGVGVPPEVQPHIFEPFFTTKPAGRGTGLGLAIVAEIVQRMGGWIECRSSVGQGTCFTVWLPAAAVRGASEQEAAPPPSPAPQTVLVVDDDPKIVQMAEYMLRLDGYQTLSAADGRQALDIYRHKQADIDVVVLDQELPGLSGLETLNELWKLNADVPVVLMSGGLQPEPSGTSGAPNVGFLSKPFSRDQLAQAVRDALASAKGGLS